MTTQTIPQGQRVLSASTNRIRFEAEWIEKQHHDKDGEWNPDRDEFEASYHATREEAEHAAIAASKKADQCEWIQVSEQKHINREWVDQRRWTGDWDGAMRRDAHDRNYRVREEGIPACSRAKS